VNKAELIDLITDLQALGVTVIVDLSPEVRTLFVDGSTPPPPPPPVTDKVIDIMVTSEDRVNARFVTGYNAAGKPIMSIYPSDLSTVKERIQFATGAKLRVYDTKVQADGNALFWKLAERKGRNNEDLYVRDTGTTRV
jgi:hypothetical protein